MSRIQNILDKAEREGASLRTARIGVPAAVPGAYTPANHVAATVPITIDIPTPASQAPVRDIVPGASAHMPAASAPAQGDAIQSYTARLHPLLVAGLAPKSPAAEQYRQLRRGWRTPRARATCARC